MIKLRYLLLKFTFLLVFFLSLVPELHSQNSFLPPSDQYNQDRLKGVVISEIAGGLLVSTGLYFLWYRKHPRTSFHLFNDNAEWLQMDKMGHITTAYNIAVIQYDLMRWCGVNNDASITIGSLTALGYMSIIEVLDGFSAKWGFSTGDMLANIAGTALFAAQQRGWNEQRMGMKFSYHGTIFPKYYPDELGKNWISKIIKDYNGQTYWLSFNLKSIMSSKSDFPAWLNVSAGYGVDGLIGARKNPDVYKGQPLPSFERYRQFYLAPDIDLLKVSSNSPFFNTGAYLTQFIKFPAPALEWNTLKRWRFHPFYF
jgi:hypothetical protein